MPEPQIPESFINDAFATEHFKRIVNNAAKYHPFYREHFKKITTQIPILSRSEVLEKNLLLLNGHPVTARTSGSTGIPVQLSWTEKRARLEKKINARYIAWLGGQLPCTKIIHVGDSKQRRQTCLDIQTPIDQQIVTIQHNFKRQGAVAITTYPTNAENLCLRIIEQSIDMSFIQRFGCYAEVFEPYQEKLINQAFPNATVWTTYSSMEFGIIAGRCPHNPKFHHIFSGKLGIEVLDQSGLPCQKNEVGRLVITDYFNTQSPFIRYEIGDLAAKSNCPCGKINLPALSYIGGKVRGALVNRAGEKVLFTTLAAHLRDLPGMKQYQVIQHEVERFEIRYVTALESESEKRLRDEIIKIVCEYFGYQPIVEFSKEQEIKREANGKFYASICRVDGVE